MHPKLNMQENIPDVGYSWIETIKLMIMQNIYIDINQNRPDISIFCFIKGLT